MVAGIPNSGKSAFAGTLAAQTNQPTLSYSADQDAWTSTTRLIASYTGEDTNQIGLNMSSGSVDYSGVLDRSKIQFCFDSNPTLEDINCELDAYVETWDEYPEVIVMDTLLNIAGSGEKQDDQYILGELHGIARRTKACVFVLVHASESNVKDPTRPPPVKEVINKVNALPDLILTVAYDAEAEMFYVAVGKTREGKADPKAERPIPIRADFSTMQFGIPSPSWGWNER